MVSNKYAKAFVEILECLKFIDKTEYNKIPAQIINYFENNKDINYIFKLDLNKNIMEQNLSQEANAINLYLYMRFFSTEAINNKIDSILIKNEKNYQEILKHKYSTENLFKNKKIKGAV